MNSTNRKTVILVPGMGNTPLLWEAQYADLSDYFDVVLADYRGSSSISAMADSVVALMPSAKVALAGFSLGGYIALDIARRYPDRLERLALISTSPYADNEAAKQQRRRLIEKAQDDYSTVLRDMGKFIVYPKV